MPLTDFQKSAILTQGGYDPTRYELDDNGYVYEKTITNIQPTVNSNPVLTKPEADTPLTTGVKSFAQAAPAALAGGYLAGLASGVGGSQLNPLAHVAPPYSEIISGIIGAGIGAWGASKLQKAIEPESWQQNVAESQAANPNAALIGSVATMPLGGFNPSPTGVVKGISAIPKLFGPGATQAELNALINVGVGGGIGAGTSVAENVMSGQPISPKDMAVNAALGMLFNKPNALDRKSVV